MGCIFSGTYGELKNPENIKNMPQCLQLYRLSKDGLLIRYLEYPSVYRCKTAVKQNPAAIQFINNPDEEVIYIVLKSHPSSIIEPSQYKTHWKISGNSGEYVWYCKRRKLLKILAKGHLSLFKRIKSNLTEDEIDWICCKYPQAASIFPEISLKTQKLIISKDGRNIKYINNPGECVDEVVMKYPWLIEFHKNPPEAVQLRAVEYNPELLQEINKPTAKVIKCARRFE